MRREGVRAKANDHYQDVDLEVIPVIDPGSTVRHFVVLFEPTSRPASSQEPAPRRQARSTVAAESDRDQEIGRLNRDLTATKHYLQAVIEQKEASNEELRAANEEVVSANEELQSTNEELTTAQEELQATNEELVTVNDELQDRIRVANQLSDDLSNLIETTRIPIVVLGLDLCVTRFTPAARQAMNLDSSDVGRSLDDLKSKINLPDLESLVHEVIDTLEIKQVETADRNGAWYKLYIRPYKTLDHKVGGVVLMFVDIDVLKRREREIEQARLCHQHRRDRPGAAARAGRRPARADGQSVFLPGLPGHCGGDGGPADLRARRRALGHPTPAPPARDHPAQGQSLRGLRGQSRPCRRRRTDDAAQRPPRGPGPRQAGAAHPAGHRGHHDAQAGRAVSP